MYHIGSVKQFLYGNELCWVDEYKYMGCYITSDFVDDRGLKRQTRAIYCRGNMIVRKFSTCSVDVKILSGLELLSALIFILGVFVHWAFSLSTHLIT